jgi:hypothetical protein
MTPFHEAWSQGAHAEVECIACHTDPELEAQAAHKVEALREVYLHFFSEPRFPGDGVLVPDERCLGCHEDSPDPGISGFDHDAHREGRQCAECHWNTGHDVTEGALTEAGILDKARWIQHVTKRTAIVGAGAANIEGHVDVVCSSCHDLAATGCESCHEREPDHFEQTCTDCHSASGEWVFTHPEDAEIDCETCHVRPAEHRRGTCSSCHATTAEWTFAHPDKSATCTSCHETPAGHRSGTCTTCHAVGTTWVFAHPSSGSTCTTCHIRPAGHRSGTCTSCHPTGTTWKFKHPSAKSTCTSCHARPSGHKSGTCTSCHSAGTTWKFSHPTSSKCASCHSAPKSHYGTECVSCHSPTRSWRSATFSHPTVPGKKHTYRSFACSKCHPSGYSSLDCTSCHEAEDD